MKKLLTILLIMTGSFAWAQIPKTLSFQGVLLDPANGQAVVDASYTFIFSIYNVDTGGSALWTETQTLTTSQGQYNAILGSVTPIDITGSESYWLGINVNTNELGRVELTSAAYLLDDDLEDLADGSLTGSKVGSGIPNGSTTATNANTASAIVSRDASGNFSAGTITANLTGNAATATKLVTARTISLTSDVSGSASFNGSGNASITATVANDSHTHDGRYYTEGEVSSNFARVSHSHTAFGPGSGAFHNSSLTIYHDQNSSTPTTKGLAISNTWNASFGWRLYNVYNDNSFQIVQGNTANGFAIGPTWYSGTSDRRIKKDIEDIEFGLQEVLNFRPVSFRMKNTALNGNERIFGLIAQEVQEVIPELIRVGEDDEKILSITYSGIFPVLIKAIQEQQAQIEDLKSQVKELQNASGVTAAVTGKE